MNLSLKIKNLSKSYSKLLFEGVNLNVAGNLKIGLIGDNGSGKSTLLKIMAGLEPADSGTITWSNNVRVGYLEQEIVNELQAASGGEKKIIKITQLFYSGNNVLLLDEPDNHLDLEQKAWFEQLVNEFAGMVIVISHDRHFLEKAVEQVWLLEEQQLQQYPFDYRKFKEVFEENMQSRQHLWEDQEKERRRLELMVKEFKKRAAKNSDLAGAYHSKEKYYARFVEKMVEKPPVLEEVNFKSKINKAAKRKTALHLKDVYFTYGEKPVLKGINLHVFCGEKVAISAPNGAGKSTLLNIITGKLKVNQGEIYVGTGLKLGVYTQEHLEALDEKLSLVEELRKVLPMDYFMARNYLKGFLFDHNQAEMLVKYLSGGQKSRLQLAKFLGTNPDLLILDEPTNHLDLKTVLSLENFLRDYQGTLILVSHDRELVGKTVDRVLRLEKGQLLAEE